MMKLEFMFMYNLMPTTDVNKVGGGGGGGCKLVLMKMQKWGGVKVRSGGGVEWM